MFHRSSDELSELIEGNRSRLSSLLDMVTQEAQDLERSLDALMTRSVDEDAAKWYLRKLPNKFQDAWHDLSNAHDSLMDLNQTCS